jgi:hypothetical protein
MSNRLNRPLTGANMSSRAVINLALDTLVAVSGGSEHDALNELINAIRDSRLGPAGLSTVLESVSDTSLLR